MYLIADDIRPLSLQPTKAESMYQSSPVPFRQASIPNVLSLTPVLEQDPDFRRHSLTIL